MSAPRTLERTRAELAEFLRSRRERISPEEVGLPAGSRRRTPGLRREEVAALAGVGLSWYTWLEQGRDISVSSTFLDNLSRALKLDATERRHLFLLAHQRLPAEPGRTWCVVPPLIHRLMADIPTRPAYVLNLRWDVLAWNAAADRVFGFSALPADRRNLLWMLFTSPAMRVLFNPWEEQALQILSSFRRDFVRATQDPEITALVRDLVKASPDFREWWQQQDVHGPCQGIRDLRIEPIGPMVFEHTTLTIDEDRHLRLVYYAAKEGRAESRAFEQWLQQAPEATGAPTA
ncbi:helix-turn-helix transcriptional regulator [Pseudomonas aeruginosa]|uniref:helix-turn-helix transcriptional regulator n=1 Tax=Pseudomonas aeruginosa TaxID=287 RepID=UPI00193E57A1|nr:helix-turn-helix transcriptional regulator [Pseudomonas aeruginosa]MBI8227654.1 helix-turn-helix domain-containing protein [Pseudomonas aeruginosa]MDP5708043.1 helix-turn-helix transcriptional regulator [Pseudomonas aeruginosa]HBO0349225.1 helix-turn-helix domain-containing protein [Pseudomonas aeruginosa]